MRSARGKVCAPNRSEEQGIPCRRRWVEAAGTTCFQASVRRWSTSPRRRLVRRRYPPVQQLMSFGNRN